MAEKGGGDEGREGGERTDMAGAVDQPVAERGAERVADEVGRGDNPRYGLPADWLYQLSIYALASPTRVSVLLYGTMNADACDERIEVRQPVHWSNERPASVILRPVPLMRLAELLDPDRQRALSTERRQWADELVILQARKSRRSIPGGGARAA